jgi:hypothetical protein
MKTHHFYDLKTGIFTGSTFSFFASVDESIVEANTPEGCRAIEGSFDHLRQRVDIETGEVVDYQPPQPDEFHEWNDETKRWQLTAQRVQDIQEDALARLQMDDLDRRTMRVLLEDKLGIKPTKADIDAGAMTLEEIQAAKTDLRSKLLRSG